jgi:hypothetical protein
MGRFIRRRNVERYWRLLNRVTNELDRKRVLELLIEERQKQTDAGDSHLIAGSNKDRTIEQASCW